MKVVNNKIYHVTGPYFIISSVSGDLSNCKKVFIYWDGSMFGKTKECDVIKHAIYTMTSYF